MPAEPAAVAQPKHPLYALTTYELRDYRRNLETALARAAQQDPVPADRPGLQARLDAVLAEQASRANLTADGRA
jgi:hypothetical protein